MCNCKVDAFSQQTETLETESRPSQVSPIFVKVSVSTFEIKVQVQDQYVVYGLRGLLKQGVSQGHQKGGAHPLKGWCRTRRQKLG